MQQKLIHWESLPVEFGPFLKDVLELEIHDAEMKVTGVVINPLQYDKLEKSLGTTVLDTWAEELKIVITTDHNIAQHDVLLKGE